MNRYKSRQKWDKLGAGVYERPALGGSYQAVKQRGGKWALLRLATNPDGEELVSVYLTLADCQEIVTRLEDPNDPMGAATESCGSCGADLGPSRTYPWHLDSEDCRAIREPVV